MVSYNSATMLLLLVLSSSLSATMANVEYGQDGGTSPSPTSSPRPTTSPSPTATSISLDSAATYAPTASMPAADASATTTDDQHDGGAADGMMMQISTSETLVMGTGKYYLDLDTGTSCVRDCSPKGTSDCGGIVDNAPWLDTFDGIEACCSTKLSWVDIAVCAGPSLSPTTPASVDGVEMSASSSAATSPTVSPSPTAAESSPTLSPSPTISRSPAIAINATAVTNYSGPPTYSMSPSFTLSPSISPTTASPTVDMNPNNTYCSANFWEPDGGDCGIPCPSGLGFAYGGTECTVEKPNCISRISTVDGTTLTCTKSHKVGVPTKWCGVSLENTTTCHKPCPNGTDAECDNGELCWGDSPCALIEKDTSKLWCARSYKHLVEHCPKPCPGGTDTECGLDEDNVTPMKCFNMEGNATDVCKEEGVGIREPVDPDNLWCGSDWNNVLETCGKKCPEGTDEECGGNGAVCYDLTGNDVICETEGVPVKVAGDPMKRYCGSNYNAMMQSCPKACPNGDECDVGQICFEESPCEAVGKMVPGYVELDTTKMFCGEDYEEAATTGEPCPEEDCPEGQTCWADVERYGSGAEEEGEESDEDELESLVDQMNDLLADLEEEGDADESETENDVEESDESGEDAEEEDGEPEGDAEADGEIEEDAEASEPEEDAEASEPEEDTEEGEPEPAESDYDSVPAESSEPPPAESANPPPAADSSDPPPAPAAAASEPTTETDSDGDGGNPFGNLDDASTSESPQSGIAVDNLRMALFGIPTLSTIQLAAWEYLTAIYFEEFYNDSSHAFDHIRDSVSDVSTDYDVTSLNVATGRRRLRRTQGDNAFLLTYTQTIQHSTDDNDIGIERVVRHPFQDSLSRDNYVAYLKGREPDLFGDLTGVSAVMVPVPFEKRVVNVADSSSLADEDSSSPPNEDSSSPAVEASSSPISDSAPSSEEDSAPSGGLFGENFYCHNSGEACPTGDCSDGDLCMFVPDGEYTPIAPYSGGSAKAPDSANSAANLVDSALAESTSPQDNLSSDTYGTVASPTVSADSSTSTSACNLCTPTQVGINSDIIFNGKPTKCAEAYDFMANHYKEGERNCIAAHAALGSACCRDAGNEAMEAMTTDYVSVPVVSPEGPASSANTVSPASSDSSTSTSPCSLCRPNQVGIDNDIIFNGAHTKCAEAFDFMSKNFKEDAPNCIAAHAALGSTCCRDAGNEAMEAMTADYVSVPVSGPSDPTSLATTDNSPSGAITSSSPDISSGTTPVLEFPSNSYYCGGSMNEASRSCQIPCPTSKDSDCPGNLKCFGNTECQNRGSFFCGTSWFDASNECSKQCPSGDALECDPGEGCFAWTSCAETASFYCGTTFEDASANCTLPCPSMSEDSCPQGQGCFQYTTCQATLESKASAADSYKPPSDYFCGESKELASMTCSIACPSGKDSECPGDLNCYDGTGCSIRDSFWCGPSWMDAAQKCTKPCSSGSSDECAKGESCYTQTGCQANMFFCGDSYETASCDKPCESRSSDECDEGQKCFAFVKDCALEGNASPLPLTQSLSSGIANTEWGVGHDVENPPDWQTKWIAETSSSWKRSASRGGALFASCSLLLSMLP